MTATHRRAKSTRGWGVAKPKSTRDRAKTAKRCGQRAFMVNKGGEHKFPVMPRRGPRKLDCRGLREAKQRASQHAKKYPGLKNRVHALAKRAGCRWAKG